MTRAVAIKAVAVSRAFVDKEVTYQLKLESMIEVRDSVRHSVGPHDRVRIYR